jgi:hypothetical protein
MFDIIFMSYEEPNADKHWDLVKKKFPWARRSHGVKGLPTAHQACAKMARTEMYYVVEGDNHITEDFDPSFKPDKYGKDAVYVYRARNSVNDLVYGYSGIKLFPTQKVLDVDVETVVDFTTAISTKFVPYPVVGSIVHYDTDPFNTWKAAFRECTKLTSKIIPGQKNDEDDARLKVWTTIGNGLYGDYSTAGARAGAEYGKNNNDYTNINNWEWLKERFNNDNK